MLLQGHPREHRTIHSFVLYQAKTIGNRDSTNLIRVGERFFIENLFSDDILIENTADLKLRMESVFKFIFNDHSLPIPQIDYEVTLLKCCLVNEYTEPEIFTRNIGIPVIKMCKFL